MRKTYVLDIETVQNPEMMKYLPEPIPNKRLKDAVKIEKDISEKKEKQVGDMILSPIFGRVASWVILDVETMELYGSDVLDGKSDNLDNSESLDWGEWQLIVRLFHNIFPLDGKLMVTWNGVAFDFPFIYKRFAILKYKFSHPYGISTPLSHFTKRYNTEVHVDMPLVLNSWAGDAKFTGLESMSYPLLGKKKTEHDHTQNIEMIKTIKGREDLVNYNTTDCVLTAEIFKIFNGLLY